MFTGIVTAVGRLTALESKGSDTRIQVATGKMDLERIQLGDSIAVSGVCLTVTEKADAGCWFDVSDETLRCTTFGEFHSGDAVNLESSLTLATPLGGHLVSGHVDGVGVVRERADAGRSVRFVIEVPAALAKYIAAKGSICVDGVSLTVNEVSGAAFAMNIVPHTLQATTLGAFQPGRRVNLEVDLVARYLERLLLGETAAASDGGGIARELLSRHGYAATS